ncbi:MAG: YdeI/OmpD-associated family protein [Bacteroidota bacterium]
MPRFTFDQRLQQLEKRKGGYHYLTVDAEIVEQFEKKKQTRLVCDIDGKVSYSCGLNHLGDGNFFIIVGAKYIKKLQKRPGDMVSFDIYEDPNPLGVEIPEVLQVLIEQDEEVKQAFEGYTDGKKRSLVYTIARVKDIDLQVQKVLKFVRENKRS